MCWPLEGLPASALVHSEVWAKNWPCVREASIKYKLAFLAGPDFASGAEPKALGEASLPHLMK